MTIRAMTTLANGRIRHSVVFTPTHAEGSDEEADLLAAIGRLAAIPGVEAFELMREVSPKNEYRYGLTMEFVDASAYQASTSTLSTWCSSSARGTGRSAPSWRSTRSPSDRAAPRSGAVTGAPLLGRAGASPGTARRVRGQSPRALLERAPHKRFAWNGKAGFVHASPGVMRRAISRVR